MDLSAAYLLSVVLEGFLLCTPVEYNWDKTVVGGECYDQSLAYLLVGTTNLVLDATIVLLPMPLVFRLHITSMKKLGFASMCGLGALICIFSLLHVISVLQWDFEDISPGHPPRCRYTLHLGAQSRDSQRLSPNPYASTSY
ncbi:hypothetical protein F4778DRAFT_732478 [Xylariomycetidae sp. FL2044]|nr:hypothetical protein F4778DRAFT_732478 [Xylariomycetidae sp. FL2044]